MSIEVDQWLLAKFPKDADNVLSNYIKTLYPSAKTVADIEAVVTNADTKLKALYLIALSRLTVERTDLRNKLPGPAFMSLTGADFEGKSEKVEMVAANNISDGGWPNPKTLFEKTDTIKAAVLAGLEQLPGKKRPEKVAGYAARLGISYGIKPDNIDENVYRFALLQQPLKLIASKQNSTAINELLFLTQGVKGFPKALREMIVKEFENVGGQFKQGKPVIIDTKSFPETLSETVEEPPATVAISLQANATAVLLFNRADTIAKQAEEIKAQLASTDGETQTAVEKIVNRLNVLKKTAIDCAESLQRGIESASNAAEIESFKARLELCTKELSNIEIESEQSVLLINQLFGREKELQEKQQQLEDCRNNRESSQRENLAKQKELQQKINDLEKTQSETATEVQTLKSQRAQLETKLSDVVQRLERIAQLKKDCSNIGKSISEALGEKNSKKLATVEERSKAAKENFETLLAIVTTKVDDLATIVNNSYENECKCREELTQLSKQSAQEAERELKLDTLVLEQKTTISELRKQIRGIEKLQKDLDQCSNDKKTQSREWEKLVQDVLQKTQTLKEENTKCETGKKVAQEEQQKLRENLEACSSKTVKIETTSQQVINEQKEQIALLTSENNRLQDQNTKMQRTLKRCETVLKNQSSQLVSCQEAQQESLERAVQAKQEVQKTHDMFIEQTIQAIGRAELDADQERFAAWIARFDKEDQTAILTGLEQGRAKGKVKPNTAASKKSALEAEVSALKKQLYDLRLVEADATERYSLSKTALDAAQQSLSNCKEQQQRNNVSQDQVKILQEELVRLTAQRDAIQQDFEANKVNAENLATQVQDLESVKILGEDELEKCKQARESLLKSSEEIETRLSSRLSTLQSANEKLSQQLRELPSVDPQILQTLQERAAQLSTELKSCQNSEAELKQQTEILLKDNDKSAQEKAILIKKVQDERLNLEKMKTQLEASKDAVAAANAELTQLDLAKKQLQQTQSKNVVQMENLGKDLQNQIESLLAERDTLRQQLIDEEQSTKAERKEKENLQNLLDKSNIEINKLNDYLRGARTIIEQLQQEVSGNK